MILHGHLLRAQRHKAVGKESGKTNYIERFNCTMRQRISRLVRKTLSFSKKLENHIAAIWFFIHHYNTTTHPYLFTTTQKTNLQNDRNSKFIRYMKITI